MSSALKRNAKVRRFAAKHKRSQNLKAEVGSFVVEKTEFSNLQKYT